MIAGMVRKRSPSKRAVAFKRWMKAKGTNTKRAAERAGISYTTLASFVQGDTQSLKGENEEKLTSAFGVPASELFGGQESNTRSIPVISWVAAGKLIDPEAQLPAETEMLEISGLDPGDYFATHSRGDSMNRIAPDGAMLIVNRADREAIRGRRYIFSRRGQTTFKRYADNPMRLEPESTNPENEPIYPHGDEIWDVVGRVRMVITEL